MRKKILLILVALLAFESFGFGFLLDVPLLLWLSICRV